MCNHSTAQFRNSDVRANFSELPVLTVPVSKCTCRHSGHCWKKSADFPTKDFSAIECRQGESSLNSLYILVTGVVLTPALFACVALTLH